MALWHRQPDSSVPCALNDRCLLNSAERFSDIFSNLFSRSSRLMRPGDGRMFRACIWSDLQICCCPMKKRAKLRPCSSALRWGSQWGSLSPLAGHLAPPTRALAEGGNQNIGLLCLKRGMHGMLISVNSPIRFLTDY